MKIKNIICVLVGSILTCIFSYSKVVGATKPRLLVLTDIGGDPDDIQSLRRFLVYSNEFQIEGFIATATWGEKETRETGVYFTNKNLILDVISDYKKVRENLLLHAPGYPTADELKAVVFGGQANRGVNNLVPGKSTPGSNHIISAVDKSDDTLNIAIWGGAHDLAQALLDIKTTRAEEEISEFISKIRVYAIGDQDKKYARIGTGEWIKENFPYLFYIEAGPSTFVGITSGYRGIFQNDSKGGEHPTLPLVKPGIEQLNNMDWVEKNILPWGDLGAGYPVDVNQNPNSPRNTKGIKEGDTPSWFYYLPNGLSNPEHPQWGCWGGRYEHVSGGHYADAQDNHWSGKTDGALRRKWAVARWREDYQNDFAARMRWCTLSYEEANHNPIPIIDDNKTKQILTYRVQPGKKFFIDASNSKDPDGDNLNFNWWIYQEASSSIAMLKNCQDSKVEVEIQDKAPEGKIHIILEVKDNGNPQLVSYRRVIIQVLTEN